ncbi:MAG: twin-arginine translocation signal domain-containing protein, partial [Candidatus Methanofastidiosia archaeon]
MGEKEDLSSIDRRTFLKLLGLGGLVAGGAGFSSARNYGIFNTAPKADFEYEVTESDRRPKA